MKVAYKDQNSVFVKDETLRPLKDDEIRIKVLACGICGTDLFEPEGQDPQKFGHEMTGKVLEVGRSVTRVSEGQTVVIESATPCGRCNNCRNAQQELCTDIQSFFYLDHFGFAEETIVPAASAIVCEDLEPEISCLSEPLGVAIDMFKLTDIQVGGNVLVSGCGPIGLMAIALAKRAGAGQIFAVDSKKRKPRMDLALEFGADTFIAIEDGGLENYEFPCEINRCMVTSPPPTLKNVFDVACKGAIVSFIGIGFGEKSRCTFDVNEFHFKKLQLRASFASPALYTPLAIRYLRDGVVNGKKLISHRFNLDQISEAFEAAKSDPNAIKIMILP